MIPNASRWNEMQRHRAGFRSALGYDLPARIHARQNGGYTIYHDGHTEYLTKREFNLLSGWYEDMAAAMAEGF